MKIRNQNVDPASQIGRRRWIVALVTAISQTGVVAFKLTPGYAFQVTSIKTYCLLKAGAASGNVKIGSRTAAAITFTSAAENTATLSTTKANIRGSKTDALTIEYTTDGSGVLTNGYVIVEVRPRPMAGDLGPI